jgi:outer membrane protein insertion porin family
MYQYQQWVIVVALLWSLVSNGYAFEAWTIKEIQVAGLKRIAVGTVFNYLPLKVGEMVDEDKTSLALSALFKTELFKDIRLERQGDTLIVRVEERPTIASITFKGNKDIETEELTKALKGIGFSEGRVFNRSLLDKVELELQRQYFSLGKYAVQLKSTVTPQTLNRVNIEIAIVEGAVASIRQIKIVGNQTFSDKVLLGEMALRPKKWFHFFSSSDRYDKQKLAGDLETLRSYYQDRGYVNFAIDSTQVTMTPDKQEVYITINLTEGDQYTVSDIKLVGNLILAQDELMSKVSVKPNNLFSRKEVTASVEALVERLGNEGYAFTNINPVPDVNAVNKTVAINFFIDPGKRIYVRRINFAGNNKTRDEVLRREMRQMEGGWLSTEKVKRSRVRLERLNYFDSVDVETPLVPGTNDQVDVNYTIVERPSGNLMAGVGFSQTQGFLFNASIEQDNFFGTGKRLGLDFNNSQVSTVYRFSYFNPYINIDGVSRGFSLFYRTTDAEEANLSRYTTDVYGTTLNYGIPLTEYNRINLGFDFDNTVLNTTDYTAEEVYQFIDRHGDEYQSYRLSTSWARDTRNHPLFPDYGMLQSFSAEVAIPGSDLTFYKVNYRQQWLFSLIKDYTLLIKGDIGYGKGYGDSEELPFFENYTAGGPRTVRGFKENTLGPLDSNGRPFGGNLRVVSNIEMILPVPFAQKARAFRMSAFFDIGNVYGNQEDFDASLLRYSTGVAAIWFSPIGIMNFSFSKPLKVKEGDQTQMFQFTVGTTF